MKCGPARSVQSGHLDSTSESSGSSLPWQACSTATGSPDWPPQGERWEEGSQLFLGGHLPSQRERNIKRNSSGNLVSKHIHTVSISYLPFFPVSPHRPLLDALFGCVLVGLVGFLQRTFTNQSYLNSAVHEPHESVSFSLLQYCWCCFAGPLAVCCSSVSPVAACSSLYGSSSVSFSSSLEFAAEESRRRWWTDTGEDSKLISYKGAQGLFDPNVIWTWPPDGQFVAGSVNELAVRQNRNYWSHWCWESKQSICTFKLNDGTYYTYPTLPKCGLRFLFAIIIIINDCITWFPGQIQWCYSQCPSLCLASLWPACSTTLPALSDSKWPGNNRKHILRKQKQILGQIIF